MAPKEIPDRWEPYIPIGSPVRGTRFIALKVPLKEHVCAKLQPKLRWTIDILTDSYPDIGMIVDLTMTTRYYNFVEVLNKGVDYCKVAIPGQQLPSESLVKRFFAAVDFYLDRRRDDSLIAVHCTHGVNRTGYMIARYMIQRMGFSVSDALESITVARGHPIERENYISDLGRHLEKLPKVLDGSDVHKGRAPGEPPRMALGVKVVKKKKPLEPRMGKDTVKRHGPARSDNRDGNEGEWKKPRRNVDPWEPGCGPERPDDFREERFNNPRNKDFRGPNINKRPVIWENEKNFDEDRGHFVERNFPEPMEERPFNRNPRDEEMERGGGDRVPRKRFPDKRGQPSHFREERGPPIEFREERGPPSSFREERGPPPHFREEREPIAPFREERGPQHHFRDDRGPPHPFREERGPPAPFREERGPPAPFREDRGPPAPFREDRGPPAPFREERGPPAPFREERGPPAPFREDRGPPAPFREGRGPPPFREERGPPPQFREERGQPLPFREERGPPQHFRDESGPSSHFRGDRDDKRNFNRGRPDDFIGDPSRGQGEKRFDGRGHHQDEHWEDNGPPHAGPVGDRRGFHGRSGSPVKRRDDYHQQGQQSGRRTSPPARRMSPKGRRLTPPGRRMSPSPGSGRRMSPPGRPMGGPPTRRMSPPGRMMSPPGRRMSPQGRRMSSPHSRRVTPPPEERRAPAPFGRMSPQPKGFPAPQPRMSPPRQRRKSPPREIMSPHRQRMSPPHHQRMSPPRQRRVTPPSQRGGSPRQMGPRGSPPRQRGLETKRGPPPALRGDVHPPFLGKPGPFERPAVKPFPHSRSPPNLKPPVGHFDVRGRQTSPGPVRMRRSRSPVKRRSPPHNFPPGKRRGSPLQGRISPPPFKKDRKQQRSGPKDNGPFDRLGDFEQRKDPRPPGPFERDDSAHSAVHPHDSGRPRHDDRSSPVHIRKSPPRFSSRHEGAPTLRRDQRDFQEHRLGPDHFQGPVNQREEHFFPAVPQPFIPQRSGSPILSRGGRSPPTQMISEQYPVREDSRNRQRSPNCRPLKEKEFPPRHIEGDSFQPRMGRKPFRSPARSPNRKDRVLDSSKKEQRPASRGRSREDRPRSSGRSKSSNIERGDQRPHSDMRGEGPSRRMEPNGPPPPIHIERPRFNDKQGGIPRDDRYRGDDPPSNYKERDIHRGASPHLSRGIPTMKPPVDYSPRRKRSSSPGFPEINDKGWDAELEQDCRELILQKRISSVARSISGVSNSSFTQRIDAVDDVIVIDDSSDPDHSRPPSRSRRRPVASRLSPKLQRRDKSRSPSSKKPVFERLDDKKPPVFERLEVASPRRPASKGSPRKPRGVPRGRR